jgi:hypothetical protein
MSRFDGIVPCYNMPITFSSESRACWISRMAMYV